MMARRRFPDGQGQEDEQWLSVSDLMAGLMVIFLFVAIAYMRPIVGIVTAWGASENGIYEALREEFEDDIDKWNAEIVEDTLTVRFKSPEILFEPESFELRQQFMDILDDFFPRYLAVLAEHREFIEEVRIEGHTSSEWWTPTGGPGQAYFLNMELSQNRAREVLEYALELDAVEPDREWARQLISAVGMSSSRTLPRNAPEDRTASRRVEFRILSNAREQIERALEEIE